MSVHSSDTIAVIGAHGRTGQQVMEVGLLRGLPMRAITRRPPERFTQAATWDHGLADVLDLVSTTKALQDAKTIICTHGVSTPWQGRKPTTLMSQGIANIMSAMAKNAANRLIVLSSIGAGPPIHEPLLFRHLIRRLMGPYFADLARMEGMISSSSLNWTIIRAPRLTTGPGQAHWQESIGQNAPKAAGISRATLANVLLDACHEPRLEKRIVGVTASSPERIA
jgi:putative NADH-flavin reductase